MIKRLPSKWSSTSTRKKVKAVYKLNRAVKSGTVTRATSCEDCGKIPKRALHGHHEDYDKPLDVVWLCAQCHRKRHTYAGTGITQNLPPGPVAYDKKGVPAIMKKLCLRCGFDWWPRQPHFPPKICPNCKCKWWNAAVPPKRGGWFPRKAR